MRGLTFDVAHLLAGTLVLVSFLELYQDRLYALLNIYALHALVLALSVAWQAYVQGAPHLYVTAAIALIFKAVIIPVALHRIIVRLGIHREIEKVVGVGSAMLLGMGLVALSMVVMLRVTAEADPLAREDLAFALAVESCCETTIEARPENPSCRRRSGGRPARDRTMPKRGSASTRRAIA